jgi:hypothetical protein
MKYFLPLFALALLFPGVASAQIESSYDPCTNDSQCRSGEYCDLSLVGGGNGACVTGPSGGGGSVQSGGSGGAGSLNTVFLSSWVNSLIIFINNIIIPLIMAIAVLVFVWGAFNYFILGGANEEKRKQGRTFILYALIGFVVIVTLWGLVWALVSFFNLGFGSRTLPYPTL